VESLGVACNWRIRVDIISKRTSSLVDLHLVQVFITWWDQGLGGIPSFSLPEKLRVVVLMLGKISQRFNVSALSLLLDQVRCIRHGRRTPSVTRVLMADSDSVEFCLDNLDSVTALFQSNETTFLFLFSMFIDVHPTLQILDFLFGTT
jgi:hypothetical protein